jgi:hypothetical protein
LKKEHDAEWANEDEPNIEQLTHINWWEINNEDNSLQIVKLAIAIVVLLVGIIFFTL